MYNDRLHFILKPNNIHTIEIDLFNKLPNIQKNNVLLESILPYKNFINNLIENMDCITCERLQNKYGL